MSELNPNASGAAGRPSSPYVRLANPYDSADDTASLYGGGGLPRPSIDSRPSTPASFRGMETVDREKLTHGRTSSAQMSIMGNPRQRLPNSIGDKVRISYFCYVLARRRVGDGKRSWLLGIVCGGSLSNDDDDDDDVVRLCTLIQRTPFTPFLSQSLLYPLAFSSQSDHSL